MKNRKTIKLKCRTEGCEDVGEVGENITARTCSKCVRASLSITPSCSEAEPED